MKRIFYFFVPFVLAAGVSFLMWGCDDKSDDLAPTGLKYLTVEDASTTQFSRTDKLNLKEAFQRFEAYVEFRDGQYRLINRVDPYKLGISREMYTILIKTMQQTNEYISTHRVVEVKRNVLKVVGTRDPLSAVTLKGLGENVPPRDTDGYDLRIYGFDLYLSHSTMLLFSAPAQTVSGALLSVGAFEDTIIDTVATYTTNYFTTLNAGCNQGIVFQYIWLAGFMNFWCQ